MSSIREQLQEQVRSLEEQESTKVASDPNRLKLHIMPQIGWINDPNGLCQFHGTYHVFYQYSPLDCRGGMKAWGHKSSNDMIHWKQEETPLYPDMPFDKDGVYSGCAIIEDDRMYLYYTGNVKHEGDHDYTHTGREANTILVTSQDGVHFTEKELVMTNADYPDNYTLQIRDPKVWKEGSHFYMLQGGRKLAEQGAALLFSSEDLHHWKYVREMTTQDAFGYMWECPDYFMLQGKHVLSFSPQGLEAKPHRYQNIYQSGYLFLEQSMTECDTDQIVEAGSNFVEWDMGFDFYAPQTFEDEKGRRILYGWAGLDGAPYDNEPTIEHGWQHALTLPRVLTLEDGKILQNPVEELLTLRREKTEIAEGQSMQMQQDFFELLLTASKEQDVKIRLCQENDWLEINYTDTDQILTLSLSKTAGHGRDKRYVPLQSLRDLRIIVDTSMIEVYVNHGEVVLTSRFYFTGTDRMVSVDGVSESYVWYLNAMEGN